MTNPIPLADTNVSTLLIGMASGRAGQVVPNLNPTPTLTPPGNQVPTGKPNPIRTLDTRRKLDPAAGKHQTRKE